MSYKRTSPQPVVEGGTGATTLTSHGVLIGNTTSAITATTAGTTGQVLTGITGSAPTFQSPAASSISITGDSGGALTGAAFTFTGGGTGLTFAGATSTETLGGTLVVSHGGTGIATATAYAPICAGTTATGAFQVASTGQSNSGYVLTSTGASSLPTWQAAGGGGGGITTLAGNTGSATGSTVTIAGGTGISTSATSSTVTVTNTGVTSIITDEAFPNTGALVLSALGPYAGGSASFLSTGLGTINLYLIQSGGTENVALGTGYGTTINNGVYGSINTYVGFNSGGDPSMGSGTSQFNVAVGQNALFDFIGSNGHVGGGIDNIALGVGALQSLASGSANIAIGSYAGQLYTTTEKSNITLGSHTDGVAGESYTLRIGALTGNTNPGELQAAYICGINGTTIGSPTAVFIDTTTDQLSTNLSSRKFKENIEDMGDYSSFIYNLRPVTFNYIDKPIKHQLPGLIAEEVDEAMPSLALYDKDGAPLTVRYHDLPALLLNEIQKLRKEVDELKRRS